ncbi:hypothetical protein WN943_012206 [Citrus x changshan-huyou]
MQQNPLYQYRIFTLMHHSRTPIYLALTLLVCRSMICHRHHIAFPVSTKEASTNHFDF